MTPPTDRLDEPRAGTVRARAIAFAILAFLAATAMVAGCSATSGERSSGASARTGSGTSPTTFGAAGATPCAFLDAALDLTVRGVALQELRALPDPTSDAERTVCSITHGTEVLVVVRSVDHGVSRSDVVYPGGTAPPVTEVTLAHPWLQVLRTRTFEAGAPTSDSIRMSDGTTVVMVGLSGHIQGAGGSAGLDVTEVLALGERLLPKKPV